jgi:pimeloyl-ACP methyl ester carboxylesterase
MKALFLTFLLFVSSRAFSDTTVLPAQVLTGDGQKLSAVWTVPQGKVVASALIIQGSGNVGADGEVSSSLLGSGYHGQSAKLSVEMAESLARTGVASLRYAKRGFDDPTQLPNQKFPYLVTDAQTAYGMLQTRFPNTKNLIIGFSEGGLVASLLASTEKTDGLFLLAPALRPIDEIFDYQYLSWPVNLLRNSLASDSEGNITAENFAAKSVSVLPLMGVPWNKIDTNGDGQLSIASELVPAYQRFYVQVRGLLTTPQFKDWYQSFKTLPAPSDFISKIKSPAITIYQGMDDAQTSWNWAVEDMILYPVQPKLRLYPHVGHCFSPMDGSIGDVKTSGPFSTDMLTQLNTDIATLGN